MLKSGSKFSTRSCTVAAISAQDIQGLGWSLCWPFCFVVVGQRFCANTSHSKTPALWTSPFSQPSPNWTRLLPLLAATFAHRQICLRCSRKRTPTCTAPATEQHVALVGYPSIMRDGPAWMPLKEFFFFSGHGRNSSILAEKKKNKLSGHERNKLDLELSICRFLFWSSTLTGLPEVFSPSFGRKLARIVACFTFPVAVLLLLWNMLTFETVHRRWTKWLAGVRVEKCVAQSG